MSKKWNHTEAYEWLINSATRRKLHGSLIITVKFNRGTPTQIFASQSYNEEKLNLEQGKIVDNEIKSG